MTARDDPPAELPDDTVHVSCSEALESDGDPANTCGEPPVPSAPVTLTTVAPASPTPTSVPSVFACEEIAIGDDVLLTFSGSGFSGAQLHIVDGVWLADITGVASIKVLDGAGLDFELRVEGEGFDDPYEVVVCSLVSPVTPVTQVVTPTPTTQRTPRIAPATTTTAPSPPTAQATSTTVPPATTSLPTSSTSEPPTVTIPDTALSTTTTTSTTTTAAPDETTTTTEPEPTTTTTTSTTTTTTSTTSTTTTTVPAPQQFACTVTTEGEDATVRFFGDRVRSEHLRYVRGPWIAEITNISRLVVSGGAGESYEVRRRGNGVARPYETVRCWQA